MKFFIMKGKQNPNPHGPVWKSACPLNLITGWATLSSNNCHQAFAITCNESVTSAVEEFWPTHLGRIVVIQPHWRVFEHEPAFLRSCHSISIGFRSGLWLGHSKVFILFFFSHSEVDLLVCFGSLSCCRTQVRFSLRSRTDGRTLSFRIFW